MADTKISNLTENTTPIGGDYFPTVDDPGGTPITKYVKGYHLAEMGDLNYKIVPTVSSNNLTLALKTLAGNNASATDPIIFKIGDSWRAVTAALSVTKNAGTNWFGSGATPLATNEIDYFAYIGYNATDGVVIGFSRIPYARQYSDFSATSTNEKYCAISTITTAASTDYYEVIGRFAATLSATASFNWSVPTFTAINLINRPIYETRSLTWSATITAQNAGTIGSTTATCKYLVNMTKVFVIYSVTVATGGGMTATGAMFLTVPFTPTQVVQLSGGEFNGGVLGWAIYATNPRISTLKYDSTTWWTNGNNVIGSGTFLLA